MWNVFLGVGQALPNEEPIDDTERNLPSPSAEDCLLFTLCLFVTLKNRELFILTKKWPFIFSNNMFCSSGKERRPRKGAAGLHGAANYETGPTWSGHWERSQHQLVPIQHAYQPAAARSRELPLSPSLPWPIQLLCAWNPSDGSVYPPVTLVVPHNAHSSSSVLQRSVWFRRKWLLFMRQERGSPWEIMLPSDQILFFARVY